jgi:hypothetical protein
MHYSRTDETDADTRGLVVMAKAGFDPAQGAEAMKVIRRAAGSGRGIPKLLRSHPAPDDRIARLNRHAAEIKAEYARHAPPPDPEAPTPAERLAAVPTATIPGLAGVVVAACRYYPLKTGARWRYRTTSDAGSAEMSVTALEMVPGTPQGVYRLETNLGRGVTAVQWIATTPDRVLRREGESDRWRTQFAFPTLPAGETAPMAAAASDAHAGALREIQENRPPGSTATMPGFRAVARESLRVPAGEFEALKVECLSPAGEVTATCWFAPEVGLVKRVSAASGTTQVLESLHMPPDRPGAVPPAVATGDAADPKDRPAGPEERETDLDPRPGSDREPRNDR